MAKIISAPSVQMDRRRPLPNGLSVSVAGPECASDERPKVVSDERSVSDGAVAEQSVELEKLNRQLDALRQRARANEEALAELREQLEAERERARQSGYREGERQGREEAAQEQEKQIEALRALLQSLAKEQECLIRGAEDAAVEIGFAAAAKIMGQAEVDRSLVQAMVKQAMTLVLEREGLIIHLAPDDCRWMEKQLSTDPEGREWTDIEFKADEQIGLGGCVIESRLGSLDARLELQLAALKELLLDARARKRTG